MDGVCNNVKKIIRFGKKNHLSYNQIKIGKYEWIQHLSFCSIKNKNKYFFS